MAHEPTQLAGGPGLSPGLTGFPGLDDIPDPAAHVARRPAPEPVLPEGPSPTRPERARRATAALLVGVGWLGAGLAISGLRPDIRSARIAVPLALLLLIAAAALWITLRPRARGLPAGVRVVQAVALLLPAAFAGLVLLGVRPGEPLPEGGTLRCLVAAGEWTVVPLALAALLLRRSFLTAPVWRGAAVGAVCGLSGAIAIHAHCRYAETGHVLLGHGVPIVAGALLGALAGALRGRA